MDKPRLRPRFDQLYVEHQQIGSVDENERQDSSEGGQPHKEVRKRR